MHKKYNKFLIVSFIIVSILGVYSYFYNDLRSEAATTVDGESPLTSSLDTTITSTNTVTTSNQVTEDTAFLMKLVSLTRIKVDASLFTNKAFQLLVDNNIKLEAVPYGRTNPFSPTTGSVLNTTNNKITFLLKTNPATLVTSKSAILNGSLEGATSDNIYFEYGTTDTLGKVTPKVIPSLIGNFASNLIGLTSKTTYFFRAVASVNGALTFGDITSFTTN
ncbi:MAG: hypothetical protein NTV03_02620 [Candidatus Nomurabacteria bacterium]|nr:hypothetical protein [Candidatus Nomurabacteria bacterium]